MGRRQVEPGKDVRFRLRRTHEETKASAAGEAASLLPALSAQMPWLDRIAEEKIQAAIERGELDDLPGAGKPLRIETHPFVPDDLQMAYKILKDAGFVPPELELKREIVTLRELLGTVTEEEERVALARRINECVLRLNLMLKRSLTNEDRQVYARKVRNKLEG